MKKLTVLLALMLVVTIGGVYATWSYAGTNDIADSFAEAKVTITDAVLTGANGTYTIESNLVLSIDQKNDNHETELIYSSNDGQPIYLKVTFTPAANAPQEIKNAAVPSELYFGTTTTMTYSIDADGDYDANGTATEIFKFKNKSDGNFSKNFDWTPESNGTFTYTLDEAALKEEIQLSQTFVLDTKAEHDQFRAALSGNIIARVTDGNFTT